MTIKLLLILALSAFVQVGLTSVITGMYENGAAAAAGILQHLKIHIAAETVCCMDLQRTTVSTNLQYADAVSAGRAQSLPRCALCSKTVGPISQ